MIAVVYSGSRHADWKLAEKDRVICNFKTTGINPFFNDEKFIAHLLNKNNQLINYAEKIKRIYFFGAGASSEERKKIVSNAFSRFFKHSKIVVDHDMQGAALATCQDHKGIVGIIGSGSNAAYFDGKKYRVNNFGLGYVLGDEGSANWLGKRLLKLYLNETLPLTINEEFKRKYDLDRKQILDKVYRQTQPALFLSSFADFLMENKNDNFVKQLVQNGFNEYIKTYIVPLTKPSDQIPIHIVGTIAFGFQEWLFEVAEDHQLKIASVIKEPINNLLNYYLNKN
ncbi:MAG: hypothetical protein WBP45_04965 [Daejeonella sp.]